MELIQQCYHYLFWGALVFLGLGLLAVMVYIIRARLTADRIIGINLTGTLVAIIIAGRGLPGGRGHRVCGAVVYRGNAAVPHLHQPVPAQAAGQEGGRIA